MAAVSDTSTSRAAAAPVLAEYSAVDHRRRLLNIRLGQRGIRTCLRKHLITSYLPGQCCYNLGEYPCRKPWDPDEWDEQELDRLRDHGIRLIQVHEEWNDSQRLFGGHKFAPLNPDGFRRFVDMVHRRGMKLIVYVSSGYFEQTDPDFRREWTSAGDQPLREIYFRYAHCSPASPGWRAYFLSNLVRILDDYGVDGIYNDLGYDQPPDITGQPTGDQVLAFEENATHDGALADLLALIYAEVHRRGGVVKVHRGGASRPQTDEKVYDYLWVGEGRGKATAARGRQGLPALRRSVPGHEPSQDRQRRRTLPARDSVPAVPVAVGGPTVHRRAGRDPRHRLSARGELFLDAALPRDLETLSGEPERSAQLRLVGLGARSAGGSARTRRVAETVSAAGRRGHLGLAGNRRVLAVCATHCPAASSLRPSPIESCISCWPTTRRHPWKWPPPTNSRTSRKPRHRLLEKPGVWPGDRSASCADNAARTNDGHSDESCRLVKRGRIRQ